jgi:hypothetical protein
MNYRYPFFVGNDLASFFECLGVHSKSIVAVSYTAPVINAKVTIEFAENLALHILNFFLNQRCELNIGLDNPTFSNHALVFGPSGAMVGS